MKSALIIAVLAAAVAGVAGYTLGTRQHTDMTAAAPADKSGGRKILYYRNPMGLPDTSPTPKKDPMGMDYIPVYEGDAPASASAGEVKISADRIQKLGVRTEEAALRDIGRTLRAVGTLQVDERRIHTVAPRFEGWIERLHVATTGQTVRKGEPLMEVYSPDLVTAQQEYLIALKGAKAMQGGSSEAQAGMEALTAGALDRLRNWDVSDAELQRLQRDAAVKRTVTLTSPVSGVVVEKPALKGMRFMPGEALYQISDLSGLWLLADVFEQDLGSVRPGQRARITVNAYPDKVFTGTVSFLYPTITPETRTGKVRIELANPGGLLKPSMYANVELQAGAPRKVVTVPHGAVIDSGVRQVVFVQPEPGRFEPRTVKLGARGDEYVEVLEGVKAGERVVTAANFLIDSESNLKAALSSFGNPSGGAGNVGHRGDGTLDAVDPKTGQVTVTHNPIASLNWPAMTMEFTLANPALVASIKPGSPITFEMVERKPGEWVITRLELNSAKGSRIETKDTQGARLTTKDAPDAKAPAGAPAGKPEAGHKGH